MTKPAKITKHDVSTEQSLSGIWTVSAIVGGYREKRRYVGYSEAESVRRFVREINRAQKYNLHSRLHELAINPIASDGDGFYGDDVQVGIGEE